jgi:hypothetical protein
MNPEDRVIPISDVPESEWPTDAKITLSRYPHLIDHGYLRDLGNEMVFKVMMGSPGISIKKG